MEGKQLAGLAVPSWLRLRVIAAVVLVVASALAGATLLDRPPPAQRYWATTRALAAGTVVTSADVAPVADDLTDTGAHYLGATDSPVGQSLTEAVEDGQLLPRAALAPAPGGTTVVIPLATGAAPPIARGQRIRLWASTATCPLVVVLPDVAVQDVSTGSSTGFGTGSAQRVAVLVPNTLAARFVAARALAGVTLRAAIVTGPATSTALPDLAACQSR